jgi:GNAT superfamily N-acetyltransferase
MPGTQSARSPLPTLATCGECERLQLADGAAIRVRSIDPRADRALPDDEYAGVAALDPDGRAVGWASYARAYGPRAEVTLHVEPLYWHRGLPQVLLDRLCLRAAYVGISTFLLTTHASEPAVLALLRAQFLTRETVDDARVRVEFPTAYR